MTRARQPRFRAGDHVCVRAADPPGHVRTPHYTRGRCGIIEGHAGDFANPEELAYGRSGEPAIPLYRVRFEQRDLWPDYDGESQDTLVADIYEHWLDPAPAAANESAPATAARRRTAQPTGGRRKRTQRT